MNILFLISSLKNFGGTERVVVNLANSLSQYHQISIANRDTSKSNSAYHINGEVEVIELKGSLLIFRSKLKTLILKNNYDLVVVHNMGKLSLLLVSLCLPEKIKLWSYEHVARISRPRLVNFLARFLYQKYSKIITITQCDAKAYQKIGYQPIVMYNPSPFKINKSSHHDNKKIISIGRLTYQKGFEQLILAWSLLEKSYPNWNVTIYGEGEDKEKLLLLIQKNKLNNIHILPAINQIDKVYEESDFYVMSSRYEGLPMVLIEAQSFSLPIISFNCPHGPSEVITNHYDGLLIENQSIQKLAEAIEYLILNQNIRFKFSNNASLSAERFNKDNVISQWVELLKNL